MSRDGRKPWEIPIQYVEDRFVERTKEESPQPFPHYKEHNDDVDERDETDVEELLRRPDRAPDEREYACNDTTPINYTKGPHDEEFGVEETDFDEAAENPPVNYSQGPHDEEFGVEDDEEFEELDSIPEFDEEV